ncbi:MAG: 3-demethylubiquinone-9 3-methyltransferase [Ferruginibacter sp.]|nr:3-demethylubiquinone-9 3-methyltransferase [Ferruginibacter sp.]
MEAIIPYLTFAGNAAAALDFYSNALNGTVLFKQTFGESPMETAPEIKDHIMHATFKAGELTLMVSDSMQGQAPKPGSNLSMSLNFTDQESIDRTFKALAEGAVITMELQDTFWGARFGMLTDQFGFNWMFNYDKEPKAHP